MRLGLIVLFVALLLAAVAGQNSLLQPTEAEDNTTAITACAVQGESCPQPPLDSSPGSVVLEYQVFVGACGSPAARPAPPPPRVSPFLPPRPPSDLAAMPWVCGGEVGPHPPWGSSPGSVVLGYQVFVAAA